MKLTGAAILVSRGMKVLQAAPATYPDRSAVEGLPVGIAKKGTRRICVDGVPYRWVARELSPGLRIVVQATELPGAVLVLRSAQNIAATHVPPSQVAVAIQSARAAGWEPQQPGAPFEVVVSL
jgi:hypothetical protein